MFSVAVGDGPGLGVMVAVSASVLVAVGTVGVGVMLAVTDGDELERLLLAHSPKFQALLDKSRRQIEETGGIPHEQFWREVEAEKRKVAVKHRGGRRRTRQVR